jgi:hypothetical protein
MQWPVFNRLRRKTMRRFVIASVASFLLSGCAGPVVAIRHTLPPALPLPDDLALPRAGEVVVAEMTPPDRVDPEAQARSLQDCLAVHLPEQGSGARQAIVDGQAYVTVDDQRSQRTVRVYDPQTDTTSPQEVQTLVREVNLRVDFTIRSVDGEVLGRAEVRRSYNSATDPEVRGELGLGRPDDPARVPAAEKILAQQCREAAEELASLLRPVDVKADVELLPVGGEHARGGLEAARQEDYAAAAEAFQAALAIQDDAQLQFNLGATAEAAGQLEQAQAAWEKAASSEALPQEKRDIARRGQARARRVGQVLSGR